MKRGRDFLKTIYPFWDHLSEEEKKIIETGCLEKSFKKNELIGQANEGCIGILNLLEGQLRVYIISDDGREITLFRIRKGESCVLSATCLLHTITFELFIEAVEDTKAILLPTYALHNIIEKNPYVELYLYKFTTERFSDVMWTMQQILFMGVDKRLAHYLWDESLRQGDMIRTTHEEIARDIGSAREVVSKTLKYLAQEGVVRLERGKIFVMDKEKLKKLL